MNETSILSIALTLFLIANPIGNVPTIAAMIKDFPFERQKIIMWRESLFSCLLVLFFQFFGEIFLETLHIEKYAIVLCGGIILFLTSLNMIFSLSSPVSHQHALIQEPFIVPIATPLISGAGVLSMTMLYANQEAHQLKLTAAVLLAWVGVTAVLISGPYLQKILGRRVLLALEQMMGLILAMMALQMFVKGSALFLKTLG